MLTVIQDGEWFVVRDTLANEDVIRFSTFGEALHLIDEIHAALYPQGRFGSLAGR